MMYIWHQDQPFVGVSSQSLECAAVTVHQQIQSGIVHQQAGRLAEAERIYRKVLAEHPDCADALHLLGVMSTQMGNPLEAVELLRRAIRISPGNPFFHGSLGNALQDLRDLDGAIEAFQRAIQIRPNLAEAHNNLGNLLRETGRLDDAIASFREAIRLKPGHVHAHSNLLAALHYHPRLDARELLDEHRKWDRQHARDLGKLIEPHRNDPNPHRRLNVGYVSADFCRHPVGRFMLPLLRSHDRQKVNVFCYSGVTAPDEITLKIRQSADVWCDAFGLNDEQLAQRIRSDAIDILVDLSLHTAGNRLLVFARKPVPVQVTWLGYAGTTGLSAMDYRLTDPFIDPPGEEQFYAEKTVRLPSSFWSYEPVDRSLEANSLPAKTSGRITFGSLNNFAKVTSEALDLWAKILALVPHSKLVILSPPGKHRGDVLGRFERAEVESARIEFVDRQPIAEYLGQFHRIDIALDPFPCGGGTTTCDAMWMGVPTITLRGRTAVGRHGVSILSNVGLQDWIAGSSQEYLDIAAKMSQDLNVLSLLRAGLRKRMEVSVLMDSARFATDLELAYREMWIQYLAQRASAK